MPQIINDGPSIGAVFGDALGTGIGRGLSRLAERKIKSLEDRQDAKSKFGEIVGDEQTQNWLQSLRPQDQLKALQWLSTQAGPSNNPANSEQIVQNLQPVSQNIDQLSSENRQPGQISHREFLNQLGGPGSMPQRLQQPQQALPQNLLQQQQLAQQLRQQQEQAALQQRAMQQQNARPQQQVAPQSNLPTLKRALAAGVRQEPKDIKLSKTQEGYVKGYDTASESVNILDRMEELWKTGKVTAGLYGNVPVGLQNAESQEYAQLGDTLAGLLVSQYGTPTNAKIKFTQGQKPQLTQAREVQKRGMDRLRKEALEKQMVARQRLPQGFFGEEESPELQAAPRKERVESAAPQENKKESDSAEGWGDWISRNVQRIRGKSGGATDVQEQEYKQWLSKLTGGKSDLTPKQQEASDKLRAEKGGTEKAQGFVEEVADKVITGLPFLGLTSGGALGKALIQDIGGSAASTAVERSGGGPVAQILASVAGGAGANRIRNYLKKGGEIKNLPKIAKEAAEISYKKADDLGSKITVEAKKYKNDLLNLHERVEDTTKLAPEERKELLGKLHKWASDAGTNLIKADKIVERKRDINSLFKNSQGKSKEYRNYLDEAQKIMFTKADQIGANHPEWYKSWKTGDDIYKAINYKPEFLRFVEDYPAVKKYIDNPIAQVLISGGTALKLGTGKFGALGVGLAVPVAKKAVQIGAFALSKSPEVRNVLKKAMQATVERNSKQAAREYARLSKATDKFIPLLQDEETPEED